GQDQKISQVKAHKIINYFTEQELAAIFRDYGEEKYARAIARKIVQVRKIAPIKTTTELVELIKKAVPAGYLHRRIHPATRVFQALRIAVNQELENLKEILPAAVDILEPGGRLVVIAYHSLEDRIVKRFFRQEAKDCLCPPQLPDCRCDHQAQIKILTPRVVKPGREEILKNPRSRSAKLRAVEKI
ncbi:MAG TPA: 16S rRNA (cytosine(1402)-N(4))-methyltransferase RsmH, partial [Patescibacteria group bacterium]